MFWTILADAYPRRLPFDELASETLARLPGHSVQSILKQHAYTDGGHAMKGLVLDNCDFIVRSVGGRNLGWLLANQLHIWGPGAMKLGILNPCILKVHEASACNG